MRILVIADVHSNWQALQAVAEREPHCDACLFVGDLVDYGTDPVPCIQWARRHVHIAVRGNHDHSIAQGVTAPSGGGFRRLAAAVRPLHDDVIDAKKRKFLARLPVTKHAELDGQSFFLVHATPRDPMDEYLTNDARAWTSRLRDIDADIVCVGHTHIQYQLEAGGKLVLNPGSVGQPRDGDPRAAYAIIENREVQLHRVEYDIDAAIDQMRTTTAPQWAIDINESILRTGGRISKEEIDAAMDDADDASS